MFALVEIRCTTKKYFECKLRNLNNKSNNEKKKKKQEEVVWVCHRTTIHIHRTTRDCTMRKCIVRLPTDFKYQGK